MSGKCVFPTSHGPVHLPWNYGCNFFFENFLLSFGLLDFENQFGWNNTVCSKDMEIGSFLQKWMWRPYMVDLCSIPFDASRRPLQFICGSQTPTECSFDARSINPQKGQKWGAFPKNFTEVQKNRKFRNYHATAFEIFDTKVLKRRIFRPFSHVFTGGQTWRFLCDFRMAIWRTKWR